MIMFVLWLITSYDLNAARKLHGQKKEIAETYKKKAGFTPGSGRMEFILQADTGGISCFVNATFSALQMVPLFGLTSIKN